MVSSILPVIAVYAAILAASALIPAFRFLEPAVLLRQHALIPLAGVFFGPIAVRCARIGGFFGQRIARATDHRIATFVSSIIAAFIAGLLCEEKKWGPLSALGIGLAFIVLWFTHPVGRESWLFALVFFGSGILCCILGFFFCNRWLKKSNFALKAIAIFIACYAGMIFSAAMSITFLLPHGLLRNLDHAIVIVPSKRALFAWARWLSAPRADGGPKIGVFIGPRDDSMDAELPMENNHLSPHNVQHARRPNAARCFFTLALIL